MNSIITLAFWVLWVVLCYKIAEKNHRNIGLACVMGLLFGLFAVIAYLIIGEKKVDTITESSTSNSEIEDIKID